MKKVILLIMIAVTLSLTPQAKAKGDMRRVRDSIVELVKSILGGK